MLTIAYFTNRPNSRIEWFLDSLYRQAGGDFSDIKMVVVDFWAQGPGAEYRKKINDDLSGGRMPHVTVPPKPTVWQGPHRLTQTDWFAASNARNTAICLAPDGWIAFVDDVSVLMPGWYKAVRAAMAGPENRITCGAYRKVRDLVVSNGNVVSFTDHPPGVDNRWNYGRDDGPVECAGNWLYGCSLVAPVEAFLRINGFPEAWCDGMGFEDCIAGIMLGKQGYTFQYDRRMLTYESEELHQQLPIMVRSDYGVSPNDKSHAVLNAALQGNGWHPNYFGEQGIRGMRERILAGESFPVIQIPQHEWFTSTPLAELQPK